MKSDSEMMDAARGIVERRGKSAIEQAKKLILAQQKKGEVISSALEYFVKATLRDALSAFPALTSLSCEIAGGKPERTTSIGAALTLISCAADIHDDIIDQSIVKYSKKTVYGKFGSDVALLAGDSLLFQGLTLLQRECEFLSKEQREAILNLTFQAFVEINRAEAAERLLKRRTMSQKKYFEIIRMKAVVPELHCKIGAIIAGASDEIVQSLGNYGRTFGVVSTIREEFIDLQQYPELRNRIQNEILPLPLLYAMRNSKIRQQLQPLLQSPNFSEKGADKIAETVLNSEESRKLKNAAETIVREELRTIQIKDVEEKQEVELLLQALIEGL